MKLIKKSKKLNNVLYDIRGPIVDRAKEMEAQGQQLIKLNIGNCLLYTSYHPGRSLREEFEAFGRIFLTGMFTERAVGACRLVFAQSFARRDIGELDVYKRQTPRCGRPPCVPLPRSVM